MAEDLTTYTELDPNGHITVDSPIKISLAGLTRQETARVSSDKGVAFFDGDFTHTMDFVYTSTVSNQFLCFWQLSNIDDDPQNIDIGGGDTINVQSNQQGANAHIDMHEVVAGSRVIADYNDGAASSGTRRWITVVRDESIGSFGELSFKVYSDSGRTNLLTTKTLTLREKEDFRYVAAASSFSDGSPAGFTGDVQNFDLGIAVVSIPRVGERIVLERDTERRLLLEGD